MKRHSGCLNRILTVLILLGILSAAMLCYMGYEKANEAEKDVVPVDQLYTIYAGSSPAADTDLLNAILNSVTEDNEGLKKIRSVLSDDTAAKMIVETFYLIDDGNISTAIGQRILIHRLKQAYTEEELLRIYCGIQGYDLADLESIAALPENGGLPNTETLGDKAASLLTNLINDLKEQGILSEEKAKEIQNLLN